MMKAEKSNELNEKSKSIYQPNQWKMLTLKLYYNERQRKKNEIQLKLQSVFINNFSSIFTN